MKHFIRVTGILIALSSTALASELWTNRDGVSVELELLRTFEEDGVLAGEFRSINGNTFIIKESSLSHEDAKRLRGFILPKASEFPLIDAAIDKLRAGEKLTQEEISKCEEEKHEYHQALIKKNETPINTEFGRKDQADFYIVVIKMALIDFANHGGWPFRSGLRRHVAEELKSRTASSDDPFLHFCAIFPSFSVGDLEHAIASFKFLQEHDPFLAEIATEWRSVHLPESENKAKFMDATKEE